MLSVSPKDGEVKFLSSGLALFLRLDLGEKEKRKRKIRCGVLGLVDGLFKGLQSVISVGCWRASLVAHVVKNLPPMQGELVSPGWGRSSRRRVAKEIEKPTVISQK